MSMVDGNSFSYVGLSMQVTNLASLVDLCAYLCIQQFLKQSSCNEITSIRYIFENKKMLLAPGISLLLCSQHLLVLPRPHLNPVLLQSFQP
mmetsp:Transcript_29315/g.67307  ORF Transcript_29315/g.67307 Transcript_29315/m.67307 type:complete len:91 (+) Transcript_29315:607-879(+)